MKKILFCGLALLLLGSGLSAEDAKVMPKMVGRLYAAPIFSFIPGEYDTEGDYQSYDESLKVFNLGFALEYGVTSWVTAAVQWVPGWTMWSDIKPAAGSSFTGDIDTNGVGDLFAGAKIQIAGPAAPIQSGRFRLAVAPGVIVPFPGPDFADEAGAAAAGDTATFKSMDNHVFGAGARVYFDYIINENFFINLYNETLFYPMAQDMDKSAPDFYAIKGQIAQRQGNPAIMNIEGEVNYRYRLTFELEPVFTMPVVEGVDFSAGLPVNYRYMPAYKYSFDFPAALAPAASALESNILANLKYTDPQHVLSVNPNVCLFLRNIPLPLEFKFQYNIPVYGKNTTAKHAAALQIRAYFALPGAR